jgi:hypothetical protein
VREGRERKTGKERVREIGRSERKKRVKDREIEKESKKDKE